MKVLYQNAQWAVTDWGLTSIKPGAPYEYEIAANRLLETNVGEEGIYSWFPQLAEKTWIDYGSFVAAFTQALDLHKGKYKGVVDPKMLAASIQYGRLSLSDR